ncbi:MAG: hypothetical protein WCI52_00290 [bacterium]
MKNIIIAVVISVVVAGGIGYFVGSSHASSNVPANPIARGNFAGRGAGGFGGGTSGSIISNSGNSLTVSLKDGSSKIVFVSASTTVMKTTAGSSSDLSSGVNVVVMGSTNSDGSITANSIQIRPSMTN